MKSIVLAAGRGSRLLPNTAVKPKCMLEVACGVRIIDRIIGALDSAGVSEIVLVTGFSSEVIRTEYPSLRYVHNANWEFTNILGSFMCAIHEMNDGVIVSYSDIVYEKETVRALMATNADVAVSVDYDWRKHYIGRNMHPETEAEKVIIHQNRLHDIGKHIESNDASAEFIGLIYLSSKAVKAIAKCYEESLNKGIDMPFYSSSTLRAAYLSDMLQHLIASGFQIVPTPVHGYWAEIDTPQDLERVKNIMSCEIEKT